MMLTTEALIAERPKDESAVAAAVVWAVWACSSVSAESGKLRSVTPVSKDD